MATLTRQELAQQIVRVSHITGEFRLRSGQVSSHYFDKYQFEADPILLRHIARELATLLPDETEILAGLELGGVPLATALALHTGLPVVFVRKAKKAYGTEKIAEGPAFAGKRLCLIEDVITTGGQVVTSASALRDLRAVVECVVCVIWRGAPYEDTLAQAGLQKRFLFGMDDLAPWMGPA